VTVATVVARNANLAVVASMVGSGGVWSQAVGFVLVRLSVAVKMFSHIIYFFNKFYKFCTFNAICKDNAAINCITTVEHKMYHFFQL
jgi:hypothetical protein